MKAFVYENPMTMPLREVPLPEVGECDVRIAVKAVGICGSDVHGFRGTTGRRKPPIIMGHEFSGVVDAVGEKVTRWKKGDRVLANPLMTCGVCENCRKGLPNVCSNRHGLGVDLNGAYAEYVKVREDMVFALPDSLTFEEGALVEPLGVAMHAVNRTPLLLCESLVIIGSGTIGLLTLLAARLKGAGKIIMIDTDDDRLAFAKKLGADEIVNSRTTDPLEFVKAVTHGRGADGVIEAVGISPTAALSLQIAANGAHVTWIGNSQPMIEINMQQIVTRELTVSGSYGFISEFETAIEAIRSGRIKPMVLVEQEAKLEDAGRLIEELSAGKINPVKVMLKLD